MEYSRHFQSGRLTYSHSIAKAYELESKIAIYPRIVVDRNIIEMYLGGSGMPDMFGKSFFLKQNGVTFLNVIDDENWTLVYMAIPKLSPYVFLKSEIVNQDAYALLPGKVNTFAGNTYTGSSQLKKVAAGEKFDLFFGSDDQVTVKREELKQHKEAGIFGKNRVSYRYRIELANFRKAPLTLTLRDQLPLSGDEEIKVFLDEPSIKPDESGTDGRITWRTPLNAGEKKELTFGILVEYPKDREITGL